MKKFALVTTILVLIILAVIFWWRFYFVFGEGVKSGELNYVVKKGYIWKTWEGKMIQSGNKELMQSNDFIFSVKTDSIAHILESNSGKCFDLHYQEFLSAAPWKGNTVFMVDRVDKIKDLKDCSSR